MLDSPPTERVTYRERTGTLEAIDALVDRGEYPNRSAALRAATRQLVSAELRGGDNA
ncbi:ribbon-helix-helix protein, CopG family [Natrinema ejinorense]|uniref:Ribbon-helix-helix protein, CopG family n=1 Tax=Natrinema ejinorense TaxID=373386 RepID=A0A2A5QPG0_9EURY|nr:ribbon-helix-helix protein, CopG family [Natrinema ejinorense]